MSTDALDDNEKDQMIELERQLEEQNNKFRQRFLGYREELDDILAREAYEELPDYCQAEFFREMRLLENDAAIMNVVVSIYQDERKNDSENRILTGVHSLRQAKERFLSLKFLMWRFEFFGESDGFIKFLENNPVSPYFLMHLIYTSSFDKGNTALKMAMLLKENERFAHAFAILNFLNQLCPEEEIIYCEMADICIRTGQIKSAKDCIARIKHPSGVFELYRKNWGI